MRQSLTGKLLLLDRTLEPTLPVFLSLLDGLGAVVAAPLVTEAQQAGKPARLFALRAAKAELRRIARGFAGPAAPSGQMDSAHQSSHRRPGRYSICARLQIKDERLLAATLRK